MRSTTITQDQIDECIEDLSVGGQFIQLYEMIHSSVAANISKDYLDTMKDTVEWSGTRASRLSILEIMYEYAQLI